jgi:acyl carrier protein
MNRKELEQKVLEVANEHIARGTATLDTVISDAFDDLDVIEITMDLEEELGIYLDDGSVDSCKTLKDFVNVVERIYRHFGRPWELL